MISYIGPENEGGHEPERVLKTKTFQRKAFMPNPTKEELYSGEPMPDFAHALKANLAAREASFVQRQEERGAVGTDSPDFARIRAENIAARQKGRAERDG